MSTDVQLKVICPDCTSTTRTLLGGGKEPGPACTKHGIIMKAMYDDIVATRTPGAYKSLVACIYVGNTLSD